MKRRSLWPDAVPRNARIVSVRTGDSSSESARGSEGAYNATEDFPGG